VTLHCVGKANNHENKTFLCDLQEGDVLPSPRTKMVRKEK
jgi:hypothetical protein